MAQTVLQQVLILSAMMMLGFLLLDVFFPCNVLAAASGDFGDMPFSQVIKIVLAYLSCFILFTILAKPIAKLIGLNEDETLVFTRSVAYPNNGFVGIPLCSAVFGTEGTVLGSLSVPCATIYMFLFVMQSFRREPEHAACCEKERQKKNDCGGKPWRSTTIKSARWRRSTRSLRGRTFCSTV